MSSLQVQAVQKHAETLYSFYHSAVLQVFLKHFIISKFSSKFNAPLFWTTHLNTLRPCKLLFGTVMYDYDMDQNPEEGIYSWNFEAGHSNFVKKKWEMAQFTIGKSEKNFNDLF